MSAFSPAVDTALIRFLEAATKLAEVKRKEIEGR